MFQLTALYNQPADKAAFDKHYNEIHAPLGKALPGLRRFTINHPGPDQDGNPPAYHLVAVLEFDDAAALQAALGGPEGEAAVADLPNFAGAGVTLLTGESREV